MKLFSKRIDPSTDYDTREEGHRYAQRRYRARNKAVVSAKEMVNKCDVQAQALNLNFEEAKKKFVELSDIIISEYKSETPVTQEDIFIQVVGFFLMKVALGKFDFHYTQTSVNLYNDLYERDEEDLPFPSYGGPVDKLMRSRPLFNRKLILFYICMVKNYKPINYNE